MSKYKLCPYLPQKEEIKAITLGNGDRVITYFSECIGKECVAFKNEKCNYGCANINVIKENEDEN